MLDRFIKDNNNNYSLDYFVKYILKLSISDQSKFFNEIIFVEESELINKIKYYGKKDDVFNGFVPQFSKVEDIDRLLEIFRETKNISFIDYSRLFNNDKSNGTHEKWGELRLKFFCSIGLISLSKHSNKTLANSTPFYCYYMKLPKDRRKKYINNVANFIGIIKYMRINDLYDFRDVNQFQFSYETQNRRNSDVTNLLNISNWQQPDIIVKENNVVNNEYKEEFRSINKMDNEKMSTKVIEYTFSDLVKKMEKGDTSVPIYQRGSVWTDKQREELIRSVKRGFPFGAILIYKNDENENKETIIDGLQRCTTINKYYKNPTLFFNEDDIDDKLIDNIYKTSGITTGEDKLKVEIKDKFLRWIKTYDNEEKLKNIQNIDFVRELRNDIAFDDEKEIDYKISSLVAPYIRRFKDSFENFKLTKIPTIIIEGDEGLLPEVFSLINKEGKVLSKYEVFAAMWRKEQYDIKDAHKRIVEYNANRYDSFEEEDNDINIDGYDRTSYMKEKKLYAFEICYGFGKLLQDNYPSLFEKTESNKISSIGFSILNACLGKKTTEMKNFSDNLHKEIGNRKINDFLDKIIICTNFVDKCLGKYSSVKSNRIENEKKSPLHAEHHIISIIANIFLRRYGNLKYNDNNENIESIEFRDFSNTKEWNSDEKLYKKYLGKKYIIEIISDKFGKQGDARLNEIITSSNNKYIEEVSFDKFKQVFDIWYENIKSNQKLIKKRKNPTNIDKLILAIIYLFEFDADDTCNAETYDIEHLCPINKMGEILTSIKNNNEGLPLGSIGNLCLLSRELNKKKSDKTIYEYFDKIKEKECKINEIETKYTFTEPKDFEFLGFKQYDDFNKLRDNFFEFIDKRKDKILKKIEDHFEKL